MVNVGDIVFVAFPATNNENKIRPALILDDLGGGRFHLAYGSSKKVDTSCPAKGEVVLSLNEAKQCGLVAPTRFDLGVRATMFVKTRVVGKLPKHKYSEFYRASVHNKLI